ncbi:MAG: hypothetical protein ACE5MI_14005, partial [Acidimicrobiia bacterium]
MTLKMAVEDVPVVRSASRITWSSPASLPTAGGTLNWANTLLELAAAESLTFESPSKKTSNGPPRVSISPNTDTCVPTTPELGAMALISVADANGIGTSDINSMAISSTIASRGFHIFP